MDPIDAISARMLKHTASAIAPSVTELFNHSIHTGQLPKDWKVSHVVPIPNRPGAKSPSDFQPISLLSVLSKVLEKHFHMLISSHVAAWASSMHYQIVNGAFNQRSLLCPHWSARPVTGYNNLKQGMKYSLTLKKLLTKYLTNF